MLEVFSFSQECERKNAPHFSIEYSKLLKYISYTLIDNQVWNNVDQLIAWLTNIQECDGLLHEIMIIDPKALPRANIREMLTLQLEALRVKITTRRIQLSQN